MLPKKFWTSKTFWFNVIALIAVVAAEYGFNLKEASENISDYAVVVITVLNVVLRFISSRPLAVK